LVTVAAFMFVGIDLLTAMLAAAATQYAFVIAAVGVEASALVLGAETIGYLQAGAIEAVLLYLTLAVGLLGGYAGIRTAASIAKRKAA
jgi:amino acid permease